MGKHIVVVLFLLVSVQIVFGSANRRTTPRPAERSAQNGETDQENTVREAVAAAIGDSLVAKLSDGMSTDSTDVLAPEGLLADDLLDEEAAQSTAAQQDPTELPYEDEVPREALVDGDTLDADPKKSFLDAPITGQNKDSMVYNVRTKTVHIYKDGDVNYMKNNLKADYMKITMEDKEIYAHGIPDTLGKKTRPEFSDGGTPYTMDTIRFNIKSGKALINGIATQEGEGYLTGSRVKKMPDNTTHFHDGRYTTCDDLECPHFYLQMKKAKLIPGKKVIIGPTYLVMADVPLKFVGLPFGFFPMNNDERGTGFIIPTYGEENRRGFFLRDGGYYFAFNDKVDLTLTGGIYTKGSWEASAKSRYLVRYKYSGNFNFDYSKNVIGEKGSQDYANDNSYKLNWTHSQDSKFKPNSNFSANVNYSTSNHSKYATTNVQDMISSSTSSSISYSKNWVGTPFSMSTSFNHSQNSRDTTYSFTLPNVSLNMSRIFPFKRKNAVGKERWYEKISMSYSGQMTNSAQNVKEYDLFKTQMFKDMKNGMNHKIPISTSMNVLKYITFSPSADYTERWFFREVVKEWDQEQGKLVGSDTTYGFKRIYDFGVSASAQTKLYGMYEMKNNKAFLRAVRHTITPSVSASYRPDFGKGNFGYYRPVQTDASGTIGKYSPWEGNAYGLPGSGQSASLSFSIKQTLEAKIRSNRAADTTGMRKISIIDDLSISGSYNVLADSMKLSKIPISLRTKIGSYTLQISGTLDPYEYDPVTKSRYDKLMLRRGIPGRLESARWSFSYSLNSTKMREVPETISVVRTRI